MGGKKIQPQINFRNIGKKTRLTMDMSFIKILRDGPEVSLHGSPTVSPTIAALWASLPFPPRFPASMYFFALSHAPPAFARNIANKKPDAVAPASKPTRADRFHIPTISGARTAMITGSIISLNAPFVAIFMHLS